MASRRRLTVAAAVLAAAVGAGIASAVGVTLPFSDDGNTINGCYSSGGALKLLTPNEPTCPKGYVPIRWNQTGPQGPAGPQGTTGAQGQPASLDTLTTVQYGKTVDVGALSDAQFVQVECPSGSLVTGGGVSKTGNVTIHGSEPYSGNGTSVKGWTADGQGGVLTGGTLTAWVVCLKLK
jgi:hypothetical protein